MDANTIILQQGISNTHHKDFLVVGNCSHWFIFLHYNISMY